MEIKDIMLEVNKGVYLHDSDIYIEYVSHEDNKFDMQVIILNLDKFLGLKNIAVIINRTLSKYGFKLNKLSLKK